MPGHAMSGTAGKARVVQNNDSDIHALPQLAERPINYLLGTAPFVKFEIGSIGQQ
jgi:hypothetical protein